MAAVVAKNAVGSSWRKTIGSREWSRVPGGALQAGEADAKLMVAWPWLQTDLRGMAWQSAWHGIRCCWAWHAWTWHGGMAHLLHMAWCARGMAGCSHVIRLSCQQSCCHATPPSPCQAVSSRGTKALVSTTADAVSITATHRKESHTAAPPRQHRHVSTATSAPPRQHSQACHAKSSHWAMPHMGAELRHACPPRNACCVSNLPAVRMSNLLQMTRRRTSGPPPWPRCWATPQTVWHFRRAGGV